MASTPEYAAPALDKGLEILDLLASQSGGLSQSEVADGVGRTVGQIFRVLATLERHGYLFRDRQSGLYFFSMRMFDLAHRHPPLRGLIVAATTPMRELADEIRQSCNLSVLDAGMVRVIAQVESPADFGYRVRVGATFSTDETVTGFALVSGNSGAVLRPDAMQPGIIDVVAPVVESGRTIAALTVPYIATTFSAVNADDVSAAALIAAAEIGRLLGSPS